MAGQAPQAPPPPPDAGLQLFQQAKTELDALPEMDRPMIFARVLELELPHYKQPALDGYRQLFNMARALPGGANSFSFYTKRQAELGAIVALSEHNDLEAALELARTADVPRAKMYDFILARAAGHWPVARGLDLVQECVQADGSYPYGGALRLAQAAKDDPITQRALLRGIYAAATHDTDIISFGLDGGFEALTNGHEMAPDLDANLETALNAMVTRIGKDPQHLNAVSGSRLLALLRQVAPDRAAELEAAYPALVEVPKRPSRYYNVNADGSAHVSYTEPADERVQDMAEKDPAGALKLASDQQDTAMRFRALAKVALALAITKPEVARQAAAQAAPLIEDDAFLNQVPVALAAVRLAHAWEKLGERASARALMLRLLDVTDSQAAAFEDTYRAAPLHAPENAPPSANRDKVFLASQLEIEPQSYLVQEVYELAGGLDFELARRRLQSLPSDILLPLTTAAVAATYRRVK